MCPMQSRSLDPRLWRERLTDVQRRAKNGEIWIHPSGLTLRVIDERGDPRFEGSSKCEIIKAGAGHTVGMRATWTLIGPSWRLVVPPLTRSQALAAELELDADS